MESDYSHDPIGNTPPDKSRVTLATPDAQDINTISPPFWNTHGRSVSNVSYQSIQHLRPTPIRLEDHSEEDDEQGKACWAKYVCVDDHTVISGTTGIGAYVVWNVTVETIKGGPFTINKRYRF